MPDPNLILALPYMNHSFTMPDPDPSFLYMAAGGSESILMAMKAARDWARNK